MQHRESEKNTPHDADAFYQPVGNRLEKSRLNTSSKRCWPDICRNVWIDPHLDKRYRCKLAAFQQNHPAPA
jgi:hypothetical protein